MIRARMLSTSGVSKFISSVQCDPYPTRGTHVRRTGMPIVLLSGIISEEYVETLIISETDLSAGGPLAANRYRR